MGKMNGSLFSSSNMNWETPLDLFKKINAVYNFDLDVCAVKETAKCDRYFAPEIDGLLQEWDGVCWMNPPYGREQVKWINKASESKCTIVCLIPARPDTKVWHNIIFEKASAVCFLKGRLKFGGSKDSAPFPSAIVVFGDKPSLEQMECLDSLGFAIDLKR